MKTSTESEIKALLLTPAEEKYSAALRELSTEYIHNLLCKDLDLDKKEASYKGYRVTIDDYFDTIDFLLLRSKIQFRVRRENQTIKITTKRPSHEQIAGLHRIESEDLVTEQQLDKHLLEQFQAIRTRNNLPSPTTAIKVQLRVIKEKFIFLSNIEGNQAEISIDSFWFTNPLSGETSKRHIEMEIESKGGTRNDPLDRFQSTIDRKGSHFLISKRSKYEMGLAALNLARLSPPQS